MKLEPRYLLIIAGVLLILASWKLGDWAIWLGGPFIFCGVIFKFVDKA